MGPAGTWVDIPDGSPFPLTNLPYGVFSSRGATGRVGVAVGDMVLDLAAVLEDEAFALPSLNPFLARGPVVWRDTRAKVTELLTDGRSQARVRPHLRPQADVQLRRPVDVADYADFYSSEHHAANLGRILRPGGDALPPNWRHLPIGYHGRSGTIVVSGTPITRPCGQRREEAGAPPSFGPSLRLDFEAEVGFVVGMPSVAGDPIGVEDFDDHVFGALLVNDWSARDIQAWEAAPLGPFLGKSFATSISPWVMPLDALEAARVPVPRQDPPPLPYLTGERNCGFDLALEVRLNGEVIARPPFAAMYWTPAQQLAHLTVNGASARTGDLYASGTVSGPSPSEWGSMIELTENGARPIVLADGSRRGFLEDGDTVAIAATAPAPGGGRLGFGEVTGTIEPAVPPDGLRS